MKQKRGRFFACLSAAVLAVSLLLGTAAAEETVYQMAVNDRFVGSRVTAATMPFRSDGVLYVPYLMFDQYTTGVKLGVSCSVVHNSAEYSLILYQIQNTLIFDLNEGSCVEQSTGNTLSMRAISRNGMIFVPLNSVCSYFGLTSASLITPYGTLVRITNGQENCTMQKFVEIATTTGRLQDRYNEYLRGQTSSSPSSSGTDSPAQTPDVTESPTADNTPGKRGVRLYMAFVCSDGAGLERILDTLESRGIYALFLFPPEKLAEQDELLRRIVGSGHGVGLTSSADSVEGVQAELEQGNALLEKLVRLRSHVVRLEETDLAGALNGQGWACWTDDIRVSSAGRSQTRLANEVLEKARAHRGAVCITLDDSETSAGALSRILTGLREDGYSIRLAVESEL